MEVYLDNSATTRTFPEVAELMTKIMCEDYGNPSSLHMKGVEAEKYLRYAKETLARILKVEERELLFTSGGTESDNMALIGGAQGDDASRLQQGQKAHHDADRTSRYPADHALSGESGVSRHLSAGGSLRTYPAGRLKESYDAGDHLGIYHAHE